VKLAVIRHIDVDGVILAPIKVVGPAPYLYDDVDPHGYVSSNPRVMEHITFTEHRLEEYMGLVKDAEIRKPC
jgi:hypothetical protein